MINGCSSRQLLAGAFVLLQSAFWIAPAAAGTGLPRPDHVVVVVEENKEFHKIIGSASAPYINDLARQGALFVTSFALTHPSQPNYLALFSGSTQGVANDDCPKSFNRPNLGSALLASGFTFAGYSESLPATGYAGCDAGPYQRKHNPWIDFINVPRALNLPFDQFPADFNQLPHLCFVVPNQDNDMHDGTIEIGDAWLRLHLDAYVQWARTHNSLLILTWDEGHSGEENRIATLFVGAMIRPGLYCEYVNHYTVLRTLLGTYDLGSIGHSTEMDPITSCWTPESANPPLRVTLVGPSDGAVFDAGRSINLEVEAAADGATVRKVEFFRAEKKLGEATSAPFRLTLSSTTAGTYWLVAKATDSLGRKKTSNSVRIEMLASDITPPSVTVLSPLPNARLSNAVVTLSGTAADDVGVARVEVAANDSAPQIATGNESWTAQVRLGPGTNLISVRGIDARGNVSVPATLKVIYVVTNPLTVTVDGSGTVAPDLNGMALVLGQRYSLTAVPAAGYLFAGWSGGVTDRSSRISFVMQSNLVLRAAFVPNPFVAAKGSYYGLFFETNEVRHESSGFVSVSITPSGAFAGTLQTHGQRYSWRGQFGLDGRAIASVSRRGTNALLAELSLDLLNGSEQLHGSISDGTWLAALAADRAVFDAATHPAPYAGRYTFALPPDSAAPAGPLGDGFGWLRMGPNGMVSLAGALADGSRVAERAPVSRDGRFPFYSSIYGGNGSIVGWLTFSNTPIDDVEGLVSWIKPGSSLTGLYPLGFTNQSTVQGSMYSASRSAAETLAGLTNALVEFSGGNLAAPFTNAVRFGSGNKVANPGANGFVMSLQPATGLWQGRASDPITGRTFAFQGAFLQKQNLGAGYFLGDSEAGRVLLVPLLP